MIVNKNSKKTKRKYREVKCKTFGGNDGEATNVLYDALELIGRDWGDDSDYAHYTALEECAESKILPFLKEHPRGSLVCYLVSNLKKFGYEIRKIEDDN